MTGFISQQLIDRSVTSLLQVCNRFDRSVTDLFFCMGLFHVCISSYILIQKLMERKRFIRFDLSVKVTFTFATPNHIYTQSNRMPQ